MAGSVVNDELARVLSSGCSMTVGTRDAKLQPHFVRAMGAVVHDDRSHITFFVPRVLADPVLADLKDNGRVALQFVEPGPFNAFQVKGRFVSSRDATPEDEALQREYQARTIETVRKVGIPAAFWLKAVYNPAIAVTIEVEQAYNQTPGPRAGERLGG